jgi:hypothetical protein
LNTQFARHAFAAGAVLAAALAAGCAANDRPGAVPRAAKSVARHTGQEVFRFVAPERGYALVYDRSTGNKMYAGWLKGGETLDVDAPGDQVRIGERVVAERDMRDDTEYEVWFERRP